MHILETYEGAYLFWCLSVCSFVQLVHFSVRNGQSITLLGKRVWLVFLHDRCCVGKGQW